MTNRWMLSALAIAGCVLDETEPPAKLSQIESALETAEVDYYCSTVYPTNGWTLLWGSGDTPCSGSTGASVRHTGFYAANNWNTVEARCSDGAAWLWVGWGGQPLSWAFNNASGHPGCEFTVTMNSQTARKDPAPGPTRGCAAGVVTESLGGFRDASGLHRVAGCAGSVAWTERDTLCAKEGGFFSVRAATLAATGVRPTHHYWTRDHLNYSGFALNCTVGNDEPGRDCKPSPMRACASQTTDTEGNRCNWFDCKLVGTTANIFGGCNSNAGTACEQLDPTLQGQPALPPHTFDAAAFRDDILQRMATAGHVGWQLAVHDANGNVVLDYAMGFAQIDPDVPMPKERRWNGGSTAKVLTATALVAAIEEAQRRGIAISLDTPIAAYLPSNWTLAARSRAVTFRTLLNHTSGLSGNGDSFAQLKSMLAAGPGSDAGMYTYRNTNYALMRILIPYVAEGPVAYRPYEGNSEQIARLTAMGYRSYVRNKVLGPIGLSAVDDYFTGSGTNEFFLANGNECTFQYSANEATLNGGAGYWTMSANEFAKFLSALARGKIVSPAGYAAMRATTGDTYTAGMQRRTQSFKGQPGFHYFEHAGGHGPCGAQSQFVIMPNGYVMMLETNTVIGLTYQPFIDAFNAALR